MPQQVLGDMIVRITGQTTEFDKSIDTSEKKLNAFQGRLKNVGAEMKKFGDAATLKLTLPILAAGTAMAKTAIDAEETASKFATVFKSVSQQAESTAKNLAKNFGLSSTAAKKLLGDTGDLLTGFGFSADEALKLSTQVNELAVDLASFTNFAGGAAGASAALTKGLLGETEGLKALGIAISQAEIERLAEDKGITGELDRQTKAALTLELALKQSKNAIGDFSRTQDGAANQLRILKADLEDLAVDFGKELIPIVKDAVRFLRDLIGGFASLDDGSKRLILQIAGVTAAIGPLTKVGGSLIGVFTAIVANPIGATIAALAAGFIALGIAIKGAIEESEKMLKIQLDAEKAFGVVDNIVKGKWLPTLEKANAAREALRLEDEKGVKTWEKMYAQAIRTYGSERNFTDAVWAQLDAQAEKNIKTDEAIKLLDKYIKKTKEAVEQDKKSEEIKTKLAEAEQKHSEEVKKALDQRQKVQEQEKEALLKAEAAKEEAHQKELERIELEKQKRRELLNFYISSVSDGLGALTDLTNARLAQIEQERDAEGKLSKKLKEEKRKLLIANKVIAVAESILSGTGAVLKTFEQFGYPAGIIPASIMGGIAAAKTAAIIATPIPKLADGGLVMPTAGGQQVIMAEAGVPEFAVPERKDVMTRLADRIVEQMARPNVTNVQNTTQNLPGKLSIDGKDFKLWLTDEMRRGNIIVPKRSIR